MKPFAAVAIVLLIVAVAQAQVGPPGTMWRGSTGPGSYNTVGPGGYATSGNPGSIPTPPGSGCVGAINQSAGCAMPLAGLMP